MLRKTLILVLFLINISCLSQTQDLEIKIPRGEYRTEILKGAVKTYEYNSYLPIVDDNGNVIKGKKLNTNERSSYAGMGYRGFVNPQGLLSKEYGQWILGYYPNSLINWEYIDNRVVNRLEFGLPDSITPQKAFRNQYDNRGLLSVVEEFENIRDFSKKIDTMVLKSSTKLIYDDKENVKKRIKKVNYYSKSYRSLTRKETKQIEYIYHLEYDGNKLIRDDFYAVDENNRPFEANIGGQIYSRIYYPNGQLKRKEYNIDGYCTISAINGQRAEFEYKDFDEQGNWTSLTAFKIINGKKEPFLIGERKITYYEK